MKKNALPEIKSVLSSSARQYSKSWFDRLSPDIQKWFLELRKSYHESRLRGESVTGSGIFRIVQSDPATRLSINSDTFRHWLGQHDVKGKK